MKPTPLAVAVVVSLIAFAPDAIAAANAQRLSGVQIRARLVGMQMTDQVHYRFVYERDGTLKSFAMGVKKIGKWSIQKDELCLQLGGNDDGCYTVTLRGEHIEMVPSGLGGPIDGIIQPAYRDWGERQLLRQQRQASANGVGKLVCYFLRLRFPGFGGPVGQMVRELVDGKEWLTKEQMREAIAMCQSLPGLLVIQLGICIAYLPARQDDRQLADHPRRPRVARDSVPHPATGVRVDGAKVTC